MRMTLQTEECRRRAAVCAEKALCMLEDEPRRTFAELAEQWRALPDQLGLEEHAPKSGLQWLHYDQLNLLVSHEAQHRFQSSVKNFAKRLNPDARAWH